MKKIGLVGGTGPESTVMYYKKLNSEIDLLTNEESMPDITIESVDFRRAWNYVINGETDKLTDYMAEKVNNLASSNAEVISLTAVTMHMVYDAVVEKTGVSLVSKVGLFGTLATMEQDYMKKDLIENGVQVFVPNEEERALIGKRIYEELEKGIVKESTLAELIGIINRMKEDDGIEGLILGCTELPLILSSDNCPVKCFDSVEVHLKKLIKLAME